MGNKIFGAVVILLWTATMSWLLSAKIMPSFFHGAPPQASANSRKIPVAWMIEFSGKPCGTAVTQMIEGVGGSADIYSRVKLNDLPLAKIAPEWMSSLLNRVGDITLDMRTRTTLDSLGELAAFDTKITLNEIPSLVQMTGRVRDGKLRLHLQTGDFNRRSEHSWSGKGLLGGELTPESKLLQVHVGKQWREEIYSPFAPPHDPIEAIEAEVVEEKPIPYEGEMINAKKIEYRSLSSAGVASDKRLRAVVWVADDGTVLRQDALFLNARVRLTRLSENRSAVLAAEYLDMGQYEVAVPAVQTIQEFSAPSTESLPSE